MIYSSHIHLYGDSSLFLSMCFIPKRASIANGIVSIIPDRVLIIPTAEMVKITVIARTAMSDDKHFTKSGKDEP